MEQGFAPTDIVQYFLSAIGFVALSRWALGWLGAFTARHRDLAGLDKEGLANMLIEHDVLVGR